MDNFWKWLMRANARGVCAASVAGLLAVIGWWTWKEFSPEREARLPPASQARDHAREGLGLTAYLDGEVERDFTSLPPDPFAYSSGIRPPAQPDPRPAVVDPRPPAQPDPEPAVKPLPPAAKPPAQPPKPAALAVTYRGMFKRTDGRTMVLLQDSKSGKTRLYPPGEKLTALEGLQIETIADGELRALDAAGQPVTLKFGEAASLQEERHGGN